MVYVFNVESFAVLDIYLDSAHCRRFALRVNDVELEFSDEIGVTPVEQLEQHWPPQQLGEASVEIPVFIKEFLLCAHGCFIWHPK